MFWGTSEGIGIPGGVGATFTCCSAAAGKSLAGAMAVVSDSIMGAGSCAAGTADAVDDEVVEHIVRRVMTVSADDVRGLSKPHALQP